MNGNPASKYYFVTFIFCLALVLLLVLRMILKKKGHTGHAELIADLQERERKLLKLHQYLEDMMDSFEKFIEEAEEEMGNVKAEMIAEVRRMLDTAPASQAPVAAQIPAASQTRVEAPVKDVPPAKEMAVPSTKNLTGKTEMVIKLHYQGKTADEIAKELGISKGEISLILQLIGK